jgi:hypothetical protein
VTSTLPIQVFGERNAPVAVRAALWCVAVVLPLFAGWLLLPRLLEPPLLWLALWRFETASVLVHGILALAALALAIGLFRWLCIQQARMIVRSADAGLAVEPWIALVLGSVVLLAVFYGTNQPLDEYDLTRIHELLRDHDPGLAYYTDRLFAADGHVYADIIGYSDQRLDRFRLSWALKQPGG